MDDERTILVHLNVAVPADDDRSAEEIADALMAALEVGGDDESVVRLLPTVALAEEI